VNGPRPVACCCGVRSHLWTRIGLFSADLCDRSSSPSSRARWKRPISCAWSTTGPVSIVIPSNVEREGGPHHQCRIRLGEPSDIGVSARRFGVLSNLRSDSGLRTPLGGHRYAGKDGAEPVTADYPSDSPWAFVGGTIHEVTVDVAGEPWVDLEKEVMAAFARQ
jgi:hypothetical protein